MSWFKNGCHSSGHFLPATKATSGTPQERPKRPINVSETTQTPSENAGGDKDV